MDTTNKSLKRHKALQPDRRKHHHALLLCWKIRTGFAKGVEAERIKKYANWFYQNHTLPHFEIEEHYIFPVLGRDDELVEKALADHKRLRRLFEGKTEITKTLSLLDEELEAHIRFEERQLFNEVQQVASPETMDAINKVHHELDFVENTSDQFWV